MGVLFTTLYKLSKQKSLSTWFFHYSSVKHDWKYHYPKYSRASSIENFFEKSASPL